MSALMSTFQSGSLSDVGVDIGGCDGKVGANLATALAALGATVDLRGADAASLRDLQASIRSQWGHARIARDRCEQAAMVRVLQSPGDVRALLASPTPAGIRTAIMIVTAAQSYGPDLLSDIAGYRGARHVHVLVGSETCDLVDLAATVAFLLSPAAQNLPNQCLHLHDSESNVRALSRKPLYPAMPVCSPAIAAMA